jgi:hypothetical protein
MYDQPVAEAEPIARFILSKEHFRSSNNTIRHNAFMPARTNDLSVFRTQGLNKAQTIELGVEHVAPVRNKPILGYAELIAAEVFSRRLRIIGTEIPHPRHANVTNWPGGLEDRVIAGYMAAVSTLVL